MISVAGELMNTQIKMRYITIEYAPYFFFAISLERARSTDG